ncbi:acyl-CoA carboxylase subunit epsilon [Streptomyces specialis]|uniref:acyl-CoA carboxylase subunit epsilon n=1 Tax=Streptomyces specialis TaxID=498367 RepID=UPI00073ECA53|nr:acyl-CoA carboxylase subunit epsilon [Streptomyces specialis]
MDTISTSGTAGARADTIRVLKGDPTREELAAVVAVLTARTTPCAENPPSGGGRVTPAPWATRDNRPARGSRWYLAR